MGGGKKAQRTKQNARPSSSGRSAQLLESTSFVGFPTLTGEGSNSAFGFPSIAPLITGLTGFQLDEGESQSVSPQMQVVLKKMNKKDAVTRLKALQEFTEMCPKLEEDEIKAVLKFWPRMFGVLATDPDHRVREAAQRSQHQLSKRAGRNIAPHLRALSGPWFVSQFDTFAPAASVASQAFQEAFPGQKYPEAIKYCQKEILKYITDNLLSQTVESVAYEKSLSPEEIDSRMERVLSSNLLAYQQYLKHLPPSELKQASDSNKNLITSPKFWKLAKHKSPLVRRTWFSALASLLHEASDILADQESNVIPTVFNNLDESDPSVLPAVWEATLYSLVSIKDCWSYVSCEKVVFPKLWHILKQGGYGNANSIYPNLLPLLSKLSPTDKYGFYIKFFSNMLIGLGQKSVQLSSAESNAIITAYIDCFMYISSCEDDMDLIQMLLTEHLLILLENCVTDRKFHMTLNPLAIQMSTLLTKWCNDKKFQQLYNMIWEYAYKTVENLKEQENIQTSFQSFVEFITLLRNPVKIKKGRKVNFSLQNNDIEVVKNEETSEEVSYIKPLTSLAILCAKELLILCETNKSAAFINIFMKLTQSYKSKHYFDSFDQRPFNLFKNIFYSWFKNVESNSTSVIELSLLILPNINREEKQEMFILLCELDDNNVVYNALAEALKISKEDKDVLKWFTSNELHKILIKLAQQVSNVTHEKDSDNTIDWKTIQLCFTALDGGGFLIKSETVSEILKIFCDALQVSPEQVKNEQAIDSCARFVADLTNSLINQNVKLFSNTLQELLLATFKLSCARCGLSESTTENLQKAWKNGIEILQLSSADLYKLCEKFSIFAHENFTIMNSQSIICSAQFISVTENDFITKIFLNVPEDYEKWEKELENLVYVTDIVANNFSWVADEDIPVVKNIDFLYDYMRVTSFHLNLLVELRKLPDEEWDEIIDDDLYKEKLIEIVYAYNLSNKIINDYKNIRICYMMMLDLDILSNTLTSFMSKLRKEDKQRIIVHAINMMKTGKHHWMWSLPLIEKWFTRSENFQNIIFEQFSLDQVTTDELENWQIWLIECLPKSFSIEHDCITRIRSALLKNENPNCATYFFNSTTDLNGLQEFICLFIKLRKLEKWNVVLKDDNAKKHEFVRVLKLLSNILKHKAEVLMNSQWDTILCSLTIWMEEVKKCVFEEPTNPLYCSVLYNVCLLLTSIQSHINQLTEDKDELSQVRSMVQEWDVLFVPELYGTVMKLFYASVDNKDPVIWEQFRLRMIGIALSRVPVKWLLIHDPPKNLTQSFKRLTAQDQTVEELCRILCSLLHHNQRVIQVTAFHLMSKLVNELVKKDEEYRLSGDTDSVDVNQLSCEILGEELTLTHSVMETMLMDFRVGDCCTVEPFTDSHLYTQAYLLTWGIIFDLCKVAKSELRYQYSQWLSNTGYTNTMLEIIFKLMPDYVVHPFFDSKTVVSPSKKCTDIFIRDFYPSFTGYNTASGIQQAACWVYRKSLEHLPAMVRTWWNNNCDAKIASMVDKLTTALVSPIICNTEMNKIVSHEKNFSNMEIKVHQGVREVIAIYKIDDVSVELAITLPINHPLGPAKVEGNKPAIDITKWKQWVMQLTVFITHQNGSIWDGLMLWKRNLDNKFKGIEECYICYSVLHGTNYQIPKLQCHTCHKKFHSSCLFRWFSTSNNSTCPLCRHLF